MSLQILTDRVTNMLGTDSGLNATIKFKTEEGIKSHEEFMIGLELLIKTVSLKSE